MHLTAGQGSLVCDYCKNVYFPDAGDDGVRVLDRAGDQFCPVCRIPLMNATLADVEILYCQRCRGLLLRMGHFATLIDTLGPDMHAAKPAADPSELARKINCPQCQRPMETHVYYGGGHVVIDDCSACSLVWLDHGEMQRIAAASCSQSQ
jgi:Zn-finger nucleic acid-binding protein